MIAVRKTLSGRARLLIGAALVLLIGLGSSCSNLRYYGQSAWGQAGMMTQRRSIEKLVAAASTTPELRRQLKLVLEVRRFATSVLALPENGSYRSYVDLDRPFAVWNVVATPEFSLEPRQWCFPVAGCVSYRGYFSETRALRYAKRLEDRGDDVSVGGVSAYSTLGWFKDPVLSTFVDWSDVRLAGLLFHELTHQRVYVKGDTLFNESLATAVELYGIERWLDATRPSAGHETVAERSLELFQEKERRVREQDFLDLVLDYRSRLAEVYGQSSPVAEKRGLKANLFAGLRADYYDLRDGLWNGYRGYDSWFDRDLNNAHLAAVVAYHDLVPGFEALLDRFEDDLEAFFAEVERLASIPREERRAALAAAVGGSEELAEECL